MYRHNWKAAERISTCMYEKIVDQLKDAGHERTVEQCGSKMKKLKQDYRKIVDSNNKTGQERKTRKFYDALNAILGPKPTTQPPIVVDTLEGDGETGDSAHENSESQDELPGLMDETDTPQLDASSADLEQAD